MIGDVRFGRLGRVRGRRRRPQQLHPRFLQFLRISFAQPRLRLAKSFLCANFFCMPFLSLYETVILGFACFRFFFLEFWTVFRRPTKEEVIAKFTDADVQDTVHLQKRISRS